MMALLRQISAETRQAEMPSSTAVEQPRRGGHLRVGMRAGGGQWTNSAPVSSMRLKALEALLYERLIELGPSQRLHSRVFSSFSIDRSGTTLRAALRDDLRFNPHPRCFPDGRTATVDDVRASLSLQRTLLQSMRVDVERVEPDGERGLVIHLSRPAPWALTSLRTLLLFPAELTGADPCDDYGGLQTPAGTGPFEVAPEGERPRRIELQRASQQSSGPPWVDRVSLLQIPTSEDCVLGLSEGSLDLCLLPRRSVDEVMERDDDGRLRVAERWRSRLADVRFSELKSDRRYALNYLLPGAGREHLASPTLRRALAALIDRRGYCASLPDRELRPMHTLLPTFLMPPGMVPPPPPPSIEEALAQLRTSLQGSPITIGVFRHLSEDRVCPMLEAHDLPCEVGLLRQDHLAQGASIVDASPVAIRDSLEDPFLRLTTLIELAERSGVDVTALTPFVSAVDSATDRAARQEATVRLATEAERVLPLIPLCFSPPDDDVGLLLLRRELRGLTERPAGVVPMVEPSNGILGFVEGLWLDAEPSDP
jgi:hypothetical protein